MAKKTHQKGRKRFRPTFFYSILMVSFALLILGIIGMGFILGDETISDIKERFEMRVILEKNVDLAQVDLLQKQIGALDYVKGTQYISEDEALRRWIEMGNENPMEQLDSNVLPAEIDINLFAQYVHADSMAMVSTAIQPLSGVKMVTYNDKVIKNLTKTIRIVFIVVVALFLIMLLIAISLIDSTIRLSMYSARFLIKSQQLIGATRKFIIAPYIQKGIVNGLISAIISILVLICLYLPLEKLLNYEPSSVSMIKMGIVFLGMVTLGVLISTWSTYRSVLKYLKMRLDDLY